MIQVVSTMPMNSVQDLGREGFRKFGISRGGAMDRLAVMVVNRMLANPFDAACLEIQMTPVRLKFDIDTVVAIGGADCAPELDGVPLPPWWAFRVAAGQIVTLNRLSKSARSYLAVKGGLDVPVVLGSRSTVVRDRFGGLDGRHIRPGDTIPIAPVVGSFWLRDEAGFGIVPPTETLEKPDVTGEHDFVLRAMPAAEYGQFDEASRTAIEIEAFTVSIESDRQGYRLQGQELKLASSSEMRSHGIVPGVVQVPPSGQPIIQLADANSAGGYPKIAVVIEADLWRLAQAVPGQKLRFVFCDRDAAISAERETAGWLAKLDAYFSLVRKQLDE